LSILWIKYIKNNGVINLAYDDRIAEMADAKGKRIAKAVGLQEAVKVACEKREWEEDKIIERAKKFSKFLSDDSNE